MTEFEVIRVQDGNEVIELTKDEKEQYLLDIQQQQLEIQNAAIAQAEALAAEEAAKQQAFNDAVAQAVAAILAAQTPATTAEPVVEEPTVTE